MADRRPGDLGDFRLHGKLPAHGVKRRRPALPLPRRLGLLPLGAHLITLLLDDTFPGGTTRIGAEEIVTRAGPYRAARNIGLESVVPVLEGYKDYAAVGLAAAFSDPGF